MSSIDFNALGDVCKDYESANTLPTFLKGVPLIARMDGQAFHTFTRNLSKPYDSGMSRSMVATAKFLVDKFNADLGYTQSDEITLLWLPKLDKDLMYRGKIHKWVSSLAAECSVQFYKETLLNLPGKERSNPTFDARVWHMPNVDLAMSVFLWRELDATKNAVSMAASTYYSEKELDGKTSKERIQLLHEKGINFDAYPIFFKRGTYVQKKEVMTTLSDEDYEAIPAKYRPESREVLRSRVVELEMSPLTTYTNIPAAFGFA